MNKSLYWAVSKREVVILPVACYRVCIGVMRD